jgi:hypothetical protein
MANYFTDIVGGTREAFQRGYENVGNIRRDIGEQQAAKALARGDTRAAKQAYGRAGMAEQVDVLGQREASQAEAMRERQEEMAETERKRTIEEQDREAQQYKNAAAQFTALGGYADALLQVPYDQRKTAWMNILRPAVASMGMPQEALTQLDAADLTDDNLTLFSRAMGQESAKLKPQVSVGQQGATVYDPETGEARFVPAQGAPPAARGAMTEYQAARLAMQQEQQDVAAAAKTAEQQTKQATNRRVFENTINGLVQGVNLVDQLIKAKGFNQIFGKNAAALTSDDPSTAQYLLTSQEALDALALLKQVTGQAFLGGIQQMKGFGQLSDREGTAVQQAMTRLANRSISPPEAKAAAKEFQASLQRFIQAAKTESGLSVQEIAEILGPKIPMRSSTRAPAAGGQPSYSPVRPGAVVTPPPPQSGSGGVQNYEDWARANGLK